MSSHSLSRAFFLFFMTPTTSGAQQGAASVFLSSGGATSIHHNFFGWYDRRSGPEVNGRVSYVMRSNRYNALWYAADVGSWMAGDIDRIGEGVGEPLRRCCRPPMVAQRLHSHSPDMDEA